MLQLNKDSGCKCKCGELLKKTMVFNFIVRYCDICWNHFESFFNECGHNKVMLVKHYMRDGRFGLRNQCLQCGTMVGGSISQSAFFLNDLPISDGSISDTYCANRDHARQKVSNLFDRYQTKKKVVFFEKYKTYLVSDEWKIKRNKVLERDEYLCQSCLIEKATQVHHLTYSHVFNEPLFDLISVCKKCHDCIHNEKYLIDTISYYLTKSITTK